MSQRTRRFLSRQLLAHALRNALVPGVSALFLASPGMALAGPLEPVTAPISQTIETVTAPITGSPPPAPSVSTPPPVQIPVPLPVKPPAIPAVEPVTSAVEPPATSPVASAQNGVETIADGATKIAGEVTEAAGTAGAARESSAPAHGSREGPPETLSGAAAAASVNRVRRHLKTARVAPFGNRFVRIWPAVALGRLTLSVLLGDLPRATLRILGQGGSSSFAAGHPGGGSGSSDDGLSDLASSVALPEPRSWFVPGAPLPPVVVYIALAGGLGAIWHLSRREVGRRTVSRRRRL
jgi:hypothetical protein